MKRMIYQVSVGKPSNLYVQCMKSVEAYCKEYGIDHIVQTKPILCIRPDPFNTGRSPESYGRLGYLPIYEKENAFNYLDDYDQIAIVDADIWIRPGAWNIFDYFEPDVDFGGVVEREMPVTPEYGQKIKNYSMMQYQRLGRVDWHWDHPYGGQFFNMGLMLMNKSIKKYLKGQTPEQFIRRSEFKDLVDGVGAWKWSTDQTLLNYWVRDSGMKYQKMPWHWNALFKGVKDESIPDAQFIHFFLKDKLPGRGEDFNFLISNIHNIEGFK